MDSRLFRPTLIFVPGAWHTTACYDTIMPLFKSFKCVRVDLPSNGAAEGSPSTWTWLPDVSAVRQAIQEEVRLGHRVLLVTHSYGSLPAQEAVKDFTGTGLISQLIIAGFMLELGESLISFFGGTIPPMYDRRVRNPCCVCLVCLAEHRSHLGGHTIL